MKNTLKTLSLFGLFLLTAMSFGQTMLPMTTLSSAVASQSTTTVQLTSVTGVVAASTAIFVADGNFGEAMFVNSVSGTTLSVTRGYQSIGSSHPHASGTLVFVIQGNALGSTNGALTTIPPYGSCTRSTTAYLPVISLGTTGGPAHVSDCAGGVWVNGSIVPKLMNFQLQLPAIGSVAYTGAGTSTAKATNTMYCTEIDLPYNKYLTGLGMLNGATATTDKWILALYDSSGNLLANSAVAGATASGASTFQKQAFTTPYYAVGPAQYFACAQGDSGTTATLNLIPTGTQDTLLAKKFASQTFGTLAAIAVPTAFTTASGGYWILY